MSAHSFVVQIAREFETDATREERDRVARMQYEGPINKWSRHQVSQWLSSVEEEDHLSVGRGGYCLRRCDGHALIELDCLELVGMLGMEHGCKLFDALELLKEQRTPPPPAHGIDALETKLGDDAVEADKEDKDKGKTKKKSKGLLRGRRSAKRKGSAGVYFERDQFGEGEQQVSVYTQCSVVQMSVYEQEIVACNSKRGEERVARLFKDADTYEKHVERLRWFRSTGRRSALALYTSNRETLVSVEERGECTLATELEWQAEWSGSRRREICRQLATAVSDLHESGYVHGELHPDAFILCREEDGRYRYKLASVENTVRVGEILTPMVEGWDEYLAPEAALSLTQSDEDEKLRADPSVDMWSLGVLIVCVVAGQTPLHGKSDVRHILRSVDGVECVTV